MRYCRGGASPGLTSSCSSFKRRLFSPGSGADGIIVIVCVCVCGKMEARVNLTRAKYAKHLHNLHSWRRN